MWLSLFFLAADPPLQAASPFAIRLVAKDGGFDVLLSNRTKKAQLYLPRFALYVRECKILDSAPAAPQIVYFAHYKTLAPDLEIQVGRITYATSALERGHIDMGMQHCDYLEAGSYFASALFNAKTKECRDCTAPERARLERMWQGVLRSNELEVTVR